MQSDSFNLGPALVTFKNSLVTSKIQGFCVSDFQLDKLGCLLGESWLEEDVFNSLLELCYFRKAHYIQSSTDNPLSSTDCISDTIILPTSFLTDARTAYEASPPVYTQEILAIRRRIASTSVRVIAMGQVHKNHFSSFIYRQGSSAIEYGDSLHNPPPHHILPILQWVFLGVIQHEIKHIRSGIISKQGIGSGAGSCGLAALNFIQLAVETPKGLKTWTGPESRLFRDVALECLLNFHHLAAQSEGTFTDWTTKIFEDEEISVSSEMMIDNLPMLATGYSDYNLYMPTVKTPFFFIIKKLELTLNCVDWPSYLKFRQIRQDISPISDRACTTYTSPTIVRAYGGCANLQVVGAHFTTSCRR
jgi:hypothetical protein